MSWLSNTWSWIKDKFNRFEMWVADIAPGFKTKAVALIGIIGTTADALQEYLTGLPTEAYISAINRSIIFAVLFTLAFWFKRLADKRNV